MVSDGSFVGKSDGGSGAENENGCCGCDGGIVDDVVVDVVNIVVMVDKLSSELGINCAVV